MPSAVCRCAYQLWLLESAHWFELSLFQSSSLHAQFLQFSSASVFLDECPHFIGYYLISIDCLYLLVMYHLSFERSSLHQTGDGVEGASRDASNASEAATHTYGRLRQYYEIAELYRLLED